MLHPVLPVSGAVHALGAGAMAAMTLAVMARATRGHTGRPLQADRATVLIYILVHLGALLRVIAPLLPFDYSGRRGRRRPVGGGLPAVPARLWSDGAATRPRSRGLTPAWQARPRPASVRRDDIGFLHDGRNDSGGRRVNGCQRDDREPELRQHGDERAAIGRAHV